MNCESCGLPMEKAEDLDGGDINNKYCKYCAPSGKLMSREQIREGWTNYIIKTENISRDEAEKKVDEEGKSEIGSNKDDESSTKAEEKEKPSTE